MRYTQQLGFLGDKMGVVTNVFYKSQRSKMILKNLTQSLLYRPEMERLIISQQDFEILIKTYPAQEQESMRKRGMLLLGKPIVSITDVRSDARV